jgi:uncharacterized repeat protein (TIGR04076 family)
MKIDDGMWKLVGDQLSLSAEELKTLKENPKYQRLLARMPKLLGTAIFADVVSSHACFSGHAVGDRLVFDGFGNLIRDKNPEKVCIYALHAVTPLVFAAFELMYAEKDPEEMLFRTAGCFDVGVACGGVGNIKLRISAVEMDSL